MNRLAIAVAWTGVVAPCVVFNGEEPAAPPAPASAAPSPPSGAPSPGAEQIRLHLMDGSLISGKLTVSEIEVETEFGKLTVPVLRIRKLRPGLGSHPQLGRQVQQLIEELGSNQFESREAAQKALLKLGLAVRTELEQRQEDRDNERRTRIKAILAELDELEESADGDPDEASPDSAVMIQQDAVETADFTIVGRIVPKDFTVVSAYGPLNVKLSDIRQAERDAPGRQETLRKAMAVEGSHLAQLGFKPSQLRLEKGDKVTVAASGIITMTPFGSRAFSTPDGAANYGWYIDNQIPSGALVAKIGDGGPIFKVGSKFAFTADRAGELHFGVGMHNNQASQPLPGQYNLKIVVRRK